VFLKVLDDILMNVF